MMHVSSHKIQKTVIGHINLSYDETADDIDAIINGAKKDMF